MFKKSINRLVITLLFASLLLTVVFTGCASEKFKTDDYLNGEAISTTVNETVGAEEFSDSSGKNTRQTATNDNLSQYDAADTGTVSEANSGTDISGNDATLISVNSILEQRKIIRNANLSIEIEDFDITYGKINTIISGIGFVQETNIKKDRIMIGTEEKLFTRGVIIIRIDRDSFDKVLNGFRELGLVYEENINSNDVTDKYFDVESRVRLLRFEEARLEKYLESLADPDIIFKTEDKLTEIRYEIEGLTGTLNKLSDLVGLSTVTLNLNEKVPGDTNVAVTKPYFERLWNDFTNSFKGVLDFCGEILLAIAAALPFLILIAVMVIIILLSFRHYKKRKTVPGKKTQE